MGENYITCYDKNGSINISEEVIGSVIKAAVAEVEGVAGLSNTAGAELAEKIGLKTISKGVKVQFVDGKIIIDLIINVYYGCNIVSTAKNVQEKLIAVVEDSTGIANADINVHVSGIAFEK